MHWIPGQARNDKNAVSRPSANYDTVCLGPDFLRTQAIMLTGGTSRPGTRGDYLGSQHESFVIHILQTNTGHDGNHGFRFHEDPGR